MECWGAQGGGNSSYPGGKASYTCGALAVTERDVFYIVMGQNGSASGTIFNNGAQTHYFAPNDIRGYVWAGGGSTDIRLKADNGDWTNFESRKSRIMVAASGGGSITYYTPQAGRYGGTVNGITGTSIGSEGVAATAATQTSAGRAGTGRYSSGRNYVGFGYIPYESNSMNGAGNGYYAGGKGNHGNATVGVGSTGSCYISGYDGCNSITESSTENSIVHTGTPNHYSGYVFTDATMIAGNASMPAPTGGTETGHTGNGACNVTQIGF